MDLQRSLDYRKATPKEKRLRILRCTAVATWIRTLLWEQFRLHHVDDSELRHCLRIRLFNQAQ